MLESLVVVGFTGISLMDTVLSLGLNCAAFCVAGKWNPLVPLVAMLEDIRCEAVSTFGEFGD